MQTLFSIQEVQQQLGLSARQVRNKVKRLGVPVARLRSPQGGPPRLLLPIEPFTQPYPPRRTRKAS